MNSLAQIFVRPSAGIVSFLISFAVISCSPSSSGSNSNKPGNNDSRVEASTNPGLTAAPSIVPGTPNPVDAALSVQLLLTHAGDAPVPVVYQDVRPILQMCTECHNSAQLNPILTNFPFQSTRGESLTQTLTKIRDRVNNTARPMPPPSRGGLLPIADRNKINAWVDGGAPEALPAIEESSELALYHIEATWTIDAQSQSSSAQFPVSGRLDVALGSLLPNKKFDLVLKVTGPRGVVVFEKSYTQLVVPASGQVILPISAPALDTLPPVPGGQGQVRATSVTHESVTLEWSAATDVDTVQNQLSYAVFQASSDASLQAIESISSASDVARGVGITSRSFSGLTPNTTYFFNVVVADANENKALYRAVRITTAEDPSIITNDYPLCISGTVTPAKIALWRDAAAQDVHSGTDTTTVLNRINSCFPQSVPECVKPTVDYLKKDDVAPTSADLPFAQSPQKQPPSELLAPGANGFEYVIPENIVEIAQSKGWPIVRYKSRHSGGFDSDTPNLMMVYVAGDKVSPPVTYDRWLNFSTPVDENATALTPAPQAPLATAADYTAGQTPSGRALPRVFTMVSLERATATRQAEVFFQMFDRNGSGPIFTPRSTQDVSSCISCHPNGLRAISPLGLHVRAGEAQLPEQAWKAAEEINNAMQESAGGRVVSWRSGLSDGVLKSFLNPAAAGPSVGPVVPLNDKGTRTREFIMGGTMPDGTVHAGCFNSRTSVSVTDIFGRAPGRNNVYRLSASPSIRWEKVRDAMSCSGCHDNVQRGALNALTSSDEIDFEILVDQSMPLGYHTNPLDPNGNGTSVQDELNGDERIALANCLLQEFELETSEIKKWLTQKSCEQ